MDGSRTERTPDKRLNNKRNINWKRDWSIFIFQSKDGRREHEQMARHNGETTAREIRMHYFPSYIHHSTIHFHHSITFDAWRRINFPLWARFNGPSAVQLFFFVSCAWHALISRLLTNMRSWGVEDVITWGAHIDSNIFFFSIFFWNEQENWMQTHVRM